MKIGDGMTLDTTQPVQLDDGTPARIICTDAAINWPIVALVMDKDGHEQARRFAIDGTSFFSEKLINTDLTPPALKIAREATAVVHENDGYTTAAKCYRDGKLDTTDYVRIALKALELAK